MENKLTDLPLNEIEILLDLAEQRGITGTIEVAASGLFNVTFKLEN